MIMTKKIQAKKAIKNVSTFRNIRNLIIEEFSVILEFIKD